MRKIVVSEFISLDGVIADPGDWHFKTANQESGKYKFDELHSHDALLMGRVTYDGFATSWPSVKDEVGFADRMNNLPKYVVSTTLQQANWNNTSIIKENVIEEVASLKQQPGQDILIFGSADLIHTLRQHNLIDEYRLMVHPVVLGSGKRLFKDTDDMTVLKLTNTQPFSSGIVVLTYQSDPQPKTD